MKKLFFTLAIFLFLTQIPVVFAIGENPEECELNPYSAFCTNTSGVFSGIQASIPNPISETLLHPGSEYSFLSSDQDLSTLDLNNPFLPTITDFVGSTLGLALSLLGTIMLISFIYGGIIWMTAAGEDSKAEKGKKVIIYTIVGFVVILSAWGIVNTLFGTNPIAIKLRYLGIGPF